MKTSKQLLVLIIFIVIATPLYADRNLDAKKADKKEVHHSMLGFRSTLTFYIFRNQQAIMTLTIDNKDETFPAKGKIYFFDDAIQDKDLAKWVNNQHSDARFMDAPKPTFTYDFPKDAYKVSSFKKTGTTENPRTKTIYHTYEVEFSVKGFSVDKKFKLSAFSDKAKVNVKTK